VEQVVELEHLQVSLAGRKILQGLSATLTGKSIGLLGPNGAGKSTLINTLLGYYPPSAGTVRVFGQDVSQHARTLRTLIGYMPENDSFIAGMSGLRYVRMMAELSGLPPAQALERAHEVFYYVGLGEQRYRPVGTYSLGMRQMAKLAQAIVHGPRLVILDEPTNGLDPAARKRMLQLMNEIRAQQGTHLLVSSHLLRDVEECCDQVLILKEGRIAAFCDLEQERRQNQDVYEVAVSDDAGRFVETLAAQGIASAWNGNGRVRAVLPGGPQQADIFGIALRSGVCIHGLERRRDSLEALFLKAME
jgi:ABC-2 type transport system ATP-binding protein